MPTFVAYPNAPNPFSTNTAISFSLARPAAVDLVIYDLRGRVVRRLISDPHRAGTHTVIWNGRDADGTPVATGTYFYRLRAGDEVRAQRMTLVR